MTPLGRRQFLTVAGAAAVTAAAPSATAAQARMPGSASPFGLAAVRLLPSPFRDNQSRNTAYLEFVDLDRLLHTFRRNVGLPSTAQPCGGWEAPNVQLRGHSTGHLLSGMALTCANTGNPVLRGKSQALVDALARCQQRATSQGFGAGYLSAFPEEFFDRLESGGDVWAPYYTLHKIMAGLAEQYRQLGNQQALDVLRRKADWVDRRTAALSYEHMQRVLDTEFGGMGEVLVDVAVFTGDDRYLEVARRFDHADVLDPLARGEDRLDGLHANTQIPKAIAAMRYWEVTGQPRYLDIAANFWRIVVDHHTYVIGGNSNDEYFHRPDVLAGQLSNQTCENCNTYNMLKLTRMLHAHDPSRTELPDYYERALFNQMLGEQDPDSPHGFNIYYTGLAPGAFKRQPSFMGPNPNVYSTDYHNFSCDHGTGMETQAKFADTVYSHGPRDLFVTLFVPSELRWADKGIGWRQPTGFPDEPRTRLEVTEGAADHALWLRKPAWASNATVTLNGQPIDAAASGGWLRIDRRWRVGDRVDLELPMSIRMEPTPDRRDVQSVRYGPVVLAGSFGAEPPDGMPRLDPGSIRRTAHQPMRFSARAGGTARVLRPVARTHHEHYTVYWRVGR